MSRIFEDVQRAAAREAKKEKAPRTSKKAVEAAPAIQNQAASTTLGDIDALAELKAKMENEK